jgi:ABC-2 type transport system permease protein
VFSKFAEFIYALPVLAVFAIFTHAHLTWHVVFVPAAMVIQVILLTGVGLLLAPLAVLYGDVERVMHIVIRLLFYFSPVLYSGADVKDRFHGNILADLYFLNPLSGLFDLYRTAFFPDQWTGWAAMTVTVVVSVAFFVAGILVFRRLEGTVLKEI